MKNSLRRFTVNLFLLCLILMAAGYGIFFLVVPDAYFDLFPLVPFLVYAITALVHIYLVRVSENDPRKFTSKYLGSIGIKMLIYIVFIAIYLAVSIEKAVPFLVSFLVCYVAFTIVEVSAMLKHQKR